MESKKMSKNQKLAMDRDVWERMRNLDKKAKIMERYFQILELYDEELEIDLL